MELIGKQIILRDYIIEDMELYKFWNTNKHNWMNFDGPYYPKLSPEDLATSIKKISERINQGRWGSPRQRLVIADKTSNQLLGSVSWYWQSEETNWKSIGITIYDETYWGKSIGFEALSLWIDYLFNQDSKLVRLDLRTWSGNKGMVKLGEKLGFKLEACFRKARIVNNSYYDSIGMGILREEWELNNK